MRYLSDEWLTKADESVRSLPPLDRSLKIGFLVTEGPDGERAYTLDLGPTRVAVQLSIASPDVTFTLTWTEATAIAQGERSAQRAFLDGTVTLTGDTAKLIGHDMALVSATDRLHSLRDETSYV